MLDNLQRQWAEAGPGARAGLAVGTLLIVAALAWALHWALQRDDQVLFADLDPQDAATIVAELDRMKLPYRLGPDGTSILVDRAEVHSTRMKLMGKGVNLRGGVGFEIFANNDFGMTDFAQRINYQRALQGELTRTIAALEEVRQVRVHLVLPESGLFRKSTVRPKAAVTVALRRGRSLSGAQVLGIQRLVAAAVPEIDASAVTLVDERGITLSRPADPEGAEGSDARIAAKSEIEQLVARKVMAVLDRAFGPGRAIVSVDVTLEHNQVRVTREDVVPGNPRSAEGAITRRRTIVTGSTAAAGDEAPRGAGSTSEMEFQNGRRIEQVVSRPGSVKQISLGILLPHALPAERADELKRLIAASVGLSPARGDELAISSLDQFAAAAAAAAPAATEPMPAAAPQLAATIERTEATSPWYARVPIGWVLALVLVSSVAAAAVVLARRTRPAPLSAHAREDLLRQVRKWLADDGLAAESKV